MLRVLPFALPSLLFAIAASDVGQEARTNPHTLRNLSGQVQDVQSSHALHVSVYHEEYIARRWWRVLECPAPSLGLPGNAATTFSVKPDRPITVRELFTLNRDDCEGTKYATRQVQPDPWARATSSDLFPVRRAVFSLLMRFWWAVYPGGVHGARATSAGQSAAVERQALLASGSQSPTSRSDHTSVSSSRLSHCTCRSERLRIRVRSSNRLGDRALATF
jgi:hypothetical protein